MLTIRLARAGAKKRPFYHVSVADSRMPRDGRFVERVGYYNPIASGQEVKLELDIERIDYWVSKGAQPSDRVLNLLKQNKETPEQTAKRLAAKEALRQKKLAKRLADKDPVEEVAEAPAEEAAPVEEVAEAPAEEVAEAPAEEVAEAPAEEEAPVEEVAEALAEEAAPVEEVAEAPAEEESPSEEKEDKEKDS
ncbi:30S ribosomal protein S16 [Gammaproteobacteria bacterium]|nr:30S ribosomal protein S16 [Gammaproteobacteria bacterium]